MIKITFQKPAPVATFSYDRKFFHSEADARDWLLIHIAESDRRFLSVWRDGEPMNENEVSAMLGDGPMECDGSE